MAWTEFEESRFHNKEYGPAKIRKTIKEAKEMLYEVKEMLDEVCEHIKDTDPKRAWSVEEK